MKHKQQKREEAEARQKKYDKLSYKQKLALFDSRRGRSEKERERTKQKNISAGT